MNFEHFGIQGVSMKPVGKGRNNQVYLVTTADDDRYILKHYFCDESDGKDRLGTEFLGLKFLWDNGLRCIPKPIRADKGRGIAIYEYIDGASFDSITQTDLDQAIKLIQNLQRLSISKKAKYFGNAAEACFSANAIADTITHRLAKLIEVPELKEFLEKEFIPIFRAVKIDDRKEIEQERRTLSPSDFGFHNALKRPNGDVVFLDFEYFGWDDPVKMICDFLLHEGMNLEENLKQYFFKNAVACFSEDTPLLDRIKALYPMFGLRWCLILLNEFLPEYIMRRDFSNQVKLKKNFKKEEQFKKAKQKLQSITNGFNFT